MVLANAQRASPIHAVRIASLGLVSGWSPGFALSAARCTLERM
jgi:hypothetical protein